jgi:hypothetical protein
VDAPRVVGLVGEERQDRERPRRRQTAQHRPRAAVAGDHRGLGQRERERHPRLDVHAGGQRSELRRVGLAAHGDEHARLDAGQRVDRGAVGVREEAVASRHRAQGDQHERALVARPPVRHGVGPRRGLAEAHRARRRIERRRREREPRRRRQAEVRRLRRQPGVAADHGDPVGDRIGEAPDVGQRDVDRDGRQPGPLGGERGRELRGVMDDEPPGARP